MPIAFVIVIALAAFVALSLVSYAVGDAIRNPETPKRAPKPEVTFEETVEAVHRPAAERIRR